LQGRLNLHNVVAQRIHTAAQAELRSCTIADGIRLDSGPNLLLDCIAGAVESRHADTRIDYCNVFGEGFTVLAKPGKGCFSKEPRFRDPENFDYRLKKNSPCREKASDGGDIGCRYTPEMLQMLKLAFELRRKGIIKF
jgi:hypothetical protein